MEPAFEKRNIVLGNPSVQPEPGDDVVREDKDGQRYVLVKRLVKVKRTVKQYNPAENLHAIARSGPRRVWCKYTTTG